MSFTLSACDWLFTTDVTPKLRIKARVDDQHHGTNKAWLDWFGFVNSKLILQP